MRTNTKEENIKQKASIIEKSYKRLVILLIISLVLFAAFVFQSITGIIKF